MFLSKTVTGDPGVLPLPRRVGDLGAVSADLHTGIFGKGAAMAKMKTVNARGTRLQKLKNLAAVLAESIDECEDARALPQLAKQYRETVREIEELEGAEHHGDEIGEILLQRKADGKPGAVRPDRTAL